MLHAIDHRRRIVPDGLPRYDSGENHSDAYVQNGAHNQRGDNSYRKIALRIASFLSGGGDRIEPDISEENNGTAGKDSRPSIGRKWVPVSRADVLRSGDD